MSGHLNFTCLYVINYYVLRKKLTLWRSSSPPWRFRSSFSDCWSITAITFHVRHRQSHPLTWNKVGRYIANNRSPIISSLTKFIFFSISRYGCNVEPDGGSHLRHRLRVRFPRSHQRHWTGHQRRRHRKIAQFLPSPKYAISQHSSNLRRTIIATRD